MFAKEAVRYEKERTGKYLLFWRREGCFPSSFFFQNMKADMKTLSIALVKNS